MTTPAQTELVHASTAVSVKIVSRITELVDASVAEWKEKLTQEFGADGTEIADGLMAHVLRNYQLPSARVYYPATETTFAAVHLSKIDRKLQGEALTHAAQTVRDQLVALSAAVTLPPAILEVVTAYAAKPTLLSFRAPPPFFVWREHGQLGRKGDHNTILPVNVPKGVTVSQISYGYDHALMIDQAGALYSFGANVYGQLGLGDSDARERPVMITMKDLRRASALRICAGKSFSFAVFDVAGESESQLFCFGANERCQLGFADREHKYSPTRLGKATDIQALSSGTFHTVAILGGVATSWGSNSYGQCGHSDRETIQNPNPIPAFDHPTTALDCAAGRYFSVVVTTDGVFTFGLNSHNQLGHSTISHSRGTPTRVANLNSKTIVNVACGGDFLACTTLDGVRLFGGPKGRAEKMKAMLEFEQALEANETYPEAEPVPITLDIAPTPNIAATSDFILAESGDGVVMLDASGEQVTKFSTAYSIPHAGPNSMCFALLALAPAPAPVEVHYQIRKKPAPPVTVPAASETASQAETVPATVSAPEVPEATPTSDEKVKENAEEKSF